MTDEQQVVSEPVEETVDYKSLYEETKTKLESLAAHQDKLLGETKKAKAAREEAAKQELERAQKAGEYEKLWKSAEDRANETNEKYSSLLKEIKSEKLNVQAMKLAVELADGDALSAKLLSRFIQESLESVSDERGNVDNGVISAIKKDFVNNKDFAPLLGGSKASGGSALGSGSMSRGQEKTISRSDFDMMNPGARMTFIKSGGKLHD